MQDITGAVNTTLLVPLSVLNCSSETGTHQQMKGVEIMKKLRRKQMDWEISDQIQMLTSLKQNC